MNEVVISCRVALPDGRNSKSLLKKVELDSDVLAIFRGAGKEGAFADWVKTNYPGYVYAPNSGAIKQPGDVGMESSSKKRTFKKSYNKSNKKSKGASLSITSGLSSISLFKKLRSSSPRDDGDKPSRKVKRLENKIEAAELKEELRQVKRLSRENKINELKESVGEKGKTVFYYFSYVWIFLDTPWKKAVTVLFVFAILGSGYQFLSDKITFSQDYELFQNENNRLQKEKMRMDSLIEVGDEEKALLILSNLQWKLKISNKLLSDSIRNKEKYWRAIKNSFEKNK